MKLDSGELEEGLRKFEESHKWIDKHYQELKAKYPDEYVAAIDGHIVAHNPELAELMNVLRDLLGGNVQNAAIEFIGSEDLEFIVQGGLL